MISPATCSKSGLLAGSKAEPGLLVPRPALFLCLWPSVPATWSLREWPSPAALYFYKNPVASPGFLRNTYPKYVRILYLVSSSYSTLTPLSVTWFTLSLKQNSRESYTSEQLLARREHSLHRDAEASRSWAFPAVNAPREWPEQ